MQLLIGRVFPASRWLPDCALYNSRLICIRKDDAKVANTCIIGHRKDDFAVDSPTVVFVPGLDSGILAYSLAFDLGPATTYYSERNGY